MIRQTKTIALGLLAAGTLLSGCGEDFATGPQQFPASLDVASWKDTLVLGERHSVTARVLDGQRREVLNRSIEWTVGAPAIVGIAPAEGDASASAALTVAGGAAVELQALQLGEASLSFVFADELFHQTTAERTVTVVTAGVQLAVESNVAVGEVGDTAVIVASAMGWNAAGESEAVAGLGLQWTKRGPGAVKLLNQGDTVRVVGEAAGTDTLFVSHPACLAGAHCADTLLVTVDGEAEPPAEPLAISPTEVEKTVNQVQQFGLTGPAGPYVWSVDGVDGGNATKGTVSGAGLYTAPGSVPAGGSVEVCGRLASIAGGQGVRDRHPGGYAVGGCRRDRGERRGHVVDGLGQQRGQQEVLQQHRQLPDHGLPGQRHQGDVLHRRQLGLRGNVQDRRLRLRCDCSGAGQSGVHAFR